MTATDDRAALAAAQDYMHHRIAWHARHMNDGAIREHLSALRSALSLPDAAQAKAQARREAIEECANLARNVYFCSATECAAADSLEKLPARIEALAAQPAAPEPVPDAFEAVARECFTPESWVAGLDHLASVLRDRFGPLVEALETIAECSEDKRSATVARIHLRQLHAYALLAPQK